MLPSLPSSTAWTQYLSSLDLFPDLNEEEYTTLLPGRGVTFEGCKACEMHDTIVHTQSGSHILLIQSIP